MQQKGILFSIFILIELAILIEIGRALSTGIVLLEVLLTAFLGFLLINIVGKKTGVKAKMAVWTMQLPAQGMVKGFMTVVGAVVLIIPGIVTDILGLLMVFPLTQGLVVNHFKNISPRIFKH